MIKEATANRIWIEAVEWAKEKDLSKVITSDHNGKKLEVFPIKFKKGFDFQSKDQSFKVTEGEKVEATEVTAHYQGRLMFYLIKKWLLFKLRGKKQAAMNLPPDKTMEKYTGFLEHGMFTSSNDLKHLFHGGHVVITAPKKTMTWDEAAL